MTRPSGRAADELREVTIIRQFTRYAEGSVLIAYGDTKVICNATIDSGVPSFLKGRGSGWVTAEYGMLPRSTAERMRREAGQSRPAGRTLEIQRLIGRAMRGVVDLKALRENTVILDCDVIQADGGTRTASITGAYVALMDAVKKALQDDLLQDNPVLQQIASVSVGIYQGEPILDLDYAEDANAETDMNVVMNGAGDFIEIQGTAEGHPFSLDELNAMLALAKAGIGRLIELQAETLNGQRMPE